MVVTVGPRCCSSSIKGSFAHQGFPSLSAEHSLELYRGEFAPLHSQFFVSIENKREWVYCLPSPMIYTGRAEGSEVVLRSSAKTLFPTLEWAM
jgi:hypothetical protein